MILSIYNFKGIKSVENLDISRVNFFAGVNSAGKSTISQLLNLLKQSLQNEYANDVLNKKTLSIDSWKDLVHDKRNGKFGFVLELDRREVDNDAAYHDGSDKMLRLRVKVMFEIEKDILTVNTFQLTIVGEERERTFSCVKQTTTPGKYKLSSNIRTLKFKANRGYFVTFSSMFPLFYEEGDSPLDTPPLPIPIVKHARDTMQAFFRRVYYIGPERGSGPKGFQSFVSSTFHEVGSDGQNTRFLLYQERDRRVNDRETLLQAASRLMCDELDLAKKIDAVKRPQNIIDVVLTDRRGVVVDLWQTGFGVSQVLPIIVQGLLCPKDGILIVDSPEIHMHPSVQAGIVDFFIEMALAGKNVIIETHSDHVLTRIRRRIAESKISVNDVNIYFVTQEANGSEYRSIMLSDKGGFANQMPKGFLDTMDEDFRAIIKARSQQ